MRKIWELTGGIHPPENKSQSNSTPIGVASLPDEIILPLSQHIGAPARLLVSIGDHVLKGQKIGEPEGFISAPIHASTSGLITAIEERPITHPSGLTGLCIVIKPDGHDTWAALTPCAHYKNETKEVLTAKIRDAGIAGMGGAGFPTAVKLQPKPNQKIETLILNGTECEPYITADDMLMRERADEVVAGAEILAFILGDPSIIIGIEDNKPEAIAAITRAAQGKNIDVVVFPTKYPSGGEKQLIQIVTGKEVPSGGLPASIGIVVQNVGTAAAVFRAVTLGEPLVDRVTTVVGQSLQKQANINVPLGTPIKHLLNAFGYDAENNRRIIIGGPMMGFTLNNTDAPVVKTTNCVLAPSPQELPAPEMPRPCMRCGMCADVCPSALLPQQLFWYSQAEDFDALKAYNLADCIECGACSYVCPSELPLVQYYRASKGTIRQLQQEKEKSDRSRLRFESRKERLAKAEEEKEAKRLARKEAAEKAKQQLAEKNKLAESAAPSAAAQISTASASAATPPASSTQVTAVDIEKLERAVTSAQMRVDGAKQKLADAETANEPETRIDTLKAAIKQAEQKLAIVQKRTADATTAADPTSAAPAIIEKIQTTPLEKIEKSIVSIQKRLTTAQQKLAEAQASESPSASALQTGVEKLQEKLASAEQELADAKLLPQATTPAETTASVSAAEQAIEKAKKKAAELAAMSDEEKQAANLRALKTRLEKARERLKNAEAENSEHIEAFRTGVEKLEDKLAQAQQTTA